MDNPVQSITWEEAILFANLVSAQHGLRPCYYVDAAKLIPIDATNYMAGTVYYQLKADGYRLPTEGEWETIARAGTTGPFSVDEPAYTSSTCSSCTADTLPVLETVAVFCANDPGGTAPVAGKQPNPWGFHDVHGNVREFCWEMYSQYYPSATTTDYTGVDSNPQFVLRGGNWDSSARYCRSAARAYTTRNYRHNAYGFRLVRTIF